MSSGSDMSDWLERVNQVLRLAKSKDSTTMQGMKDIIFGVWALMQSSDPTIRDLYRSYSEEEISQAASTHDLTSCLAEITAPARSAREKRIIFKELASRLRALENRFYAEHNGASARNSSAYEVEFDGKQGYFLDWTPRNRTPRDKGSFDKRALAHSRILPRKIGGTDVRLYNLDDPRGALRATSGVREHKFGAGLFEGLAFSMRVSDDGFVVDGVRCEGQSKTIVGQLVAATEAACCGVVYPELTIGSEVLGDLCETISSGSLNIELSLVVAGSRHAAGADGLVRNTATIVDGYGAAAVEQNKFYRYSEGAQPSESIEPGTELAVVILGDAVVACAICLDFCHRAEPTPYDDLDVDYILVPSCGEVRTMDSHLKKAQDIQLKRTVGTLVVQQFHDGKEHVSSNPLGYVLAPSALSTVDASALGTKEPWSIVTV